MVSRKGDGSGFRKIESPPFFTSTRGVITEVGYILYPSCVSIHAPARGATLREVQGGQRAIRLSKPVLKKPYKLLKLTLTLSQRIYSMIAWITSPKRNGLIPFDHVKKRKLR